MPDQNVLSARKSDHIQLTDQAQAHGQKADQRFHYEPLFGRHPENPAQLVDQKWGGEFFGKKMRAPLWISSMTGGTKEAGVINQRLARAAKQYGLGMGLGSCRAYLENPKQNLADFDLRPLIGSQAPLLGNLGIAQIEKLLKEKKSQAITDMVGELDLDGLIVHLNPLQEWFQPEGDLLVRPAIETLEELLRNVEIRLIVKEVGQGMGPRSLKALLQLPLYGLDLGAYGGTNFSKLELMRQQSPEKSFFVELTQVGHDAESMVEFLNELMVELGPKCLVNEFILSGGIQSFMQGHYLLSRFKGKAIYGYAKKFLDAANLGEQSLNTFIEQELTGLAIASEFLTATTPINNSGLKR